MDWKPSASWQHSVDTTKTFVDAPGILILQSSEDVFDSNCQRPQSALDAFCLPPPQMSLDQRRGVSATYSSVSDHDTATDKDSKSVPLRVDDFYLQWRDDDAAGDVLNWSERTIDKVAGSVVQDLATYSQESNLNASNIDSSTVESDLNFSAVSRCRPTSLSYDNGQDDAVAEVNPQVNFFLHSLAASSDTAADAVISVAMTTTDIPDMLHQLNALQVFLV